MQFSKLKNHVSQQLLSQTKSPIYVIKWLKDFWNPTTWAIIIGYQSSHTRFETPCRCICCFDKLLNAWFQGLFYQMWCDIQVWLVRDVEPSRDHPWWQDRNSVQQCWCSAIGDIDVYHADFLCAVIHRSFSGRGWWQYQHNGCWQHSGSNVCPQKDADIQRWQWRQDYHHCICSWTSGRSIKVCKFKKCQWLWIVEVNPNNFIVL